MPPHLHPRSRLTTSLFTTTLFASFLLVSLPHILPCPVDPHREYADDGQRRRRSRSPPKDVVEDAANETSQNSEGSGVENDPVVANTRECPVPKPGGTVGRLLGFTGQDDNVRARRERIPVQTIARDSDLRGERHARGGGEQGIPRGDDKHSS